METMMGWGIRVGCGGSDGRTHALRAAVAAAMLSALAAASGAVAPAAAQSPPAVALVTDVNGRTDPAIEPFSEMPAGTAVRLAPGATLNVIFYASCEELTI